MTNSKKPFFDLSAITLPEVLGWLFIIALFWSLSAYNIFVDYERRLINVHMFRLVTNETTSGFSALVLVLFVRAMLDRFPLLKINFAVVVAHFAGSIIFSVSHVVLMGLMRELVFWIGGQDYRHASLDQPGGLLNILTYEYAKDLPTYAAFAAIMLIYRYFGKSGTGVFPPDEEKVLLNKILVKKGKSDRALDLGEVDWFQAASNYVRVFAGSEEYLVRGTLADLENRLSGQPFLRVHRSFVANLDKVKQITPLEGGGHRLELTGGAHIPVGRRYKDALYARIKH